MRSHPGLFLAPGIDVAVYLLANGLGGVSPERAQILSFAAAVALGYLPLLRAHAEMKSRGWSGGLALHLAVATLIAFFVRSGVLISMHGSEGAAHAAIVIAAIATALLLHPAYAYCASHRTWRLGSGAGWQTGAIGIVIAAAALRLVYSGRVELLPEETYYWNYARHLDIGYLDHPPMVAWLIAAGTRILGGGEIGVRSGALCSGVIATFFAYRLTDNLFGRSSAVVAAVLVQTLPFFFLAGLLMTPDAPLTAAWAASLYFLERALVAGRRGAWWGAGICLGLGLLSKYTIVLVGLSAFIFAIIDPPARRWLRRPEPYGACLLALAVFSPVIVWNAQNQWVSFLFQTSRRLADRPQFALHKLIASVIVLLTPTGIAAAARALTRGAPGGESAASGDGRRDRGWRFLQVATLTPLAVFVVFSLRHEVKLDWTGAPLLAAVPLLACGIVEGARVAAAGFSALLRGSWVPTLIVLLLVYGAGLYDLTWGIPHVGYGKHAELVPVGWRALGAQIDAIAGRVGQEGGQPPLVVGMDRYAIASELAFYAPDQARGVGRTSSGHLFGQVGLMYERWFPPAVEAGRNLVLVAWNREDLLSDRVTSAVARMGPIEEGLLMRGDDVIRRYYYRLAYGYRGVGRQGSAAD
ncbi:MAG: glycosyltransferase family 39 protein [Steroidobacteraceae bacterium]|jgi:dolichol-phosphate mannosyltransferase